MREEEKEQGEYKVIKKRSAASSLITSQCVMSKLPLLARAFRNMPSFFLHCAASVRRNVISFLDQCQFHGRR